MLTFGRRRYWGEPCSEPGFALQQVSVRRLWRARGGCWPSPGARCQTMAAHSLAELEIAIRASWSRWTSDPVDHPVCSAERPTWAGAVTARSRTCSWRAARGRDRGVDWPTPRWVTSTAQLLRASSSSCLLGVGSAHSRTGPRAVAGVATARARGADRNAGAAVRAAVTPAIMSERAFGLGNRRESRKQGVRVHRRRPGCSCGFCRNRGRSVETKKHRGRWR